MTRRLRRKLDFVFGILAVLFIWLIGFYGFVFLQSYLRNYFTEAAIRLYLLCLVVGLGLLACHKGFARMSRMAQLRGKRDEPMKGMLRSVLLFLLAVMVNLFLIRNFSVTTALIINVCLLLVGIALIIRFLPEYMQSYKKQFFFEVREEWRKLRREEKKRLQ